MLKICDLYAATEGKEILRGISLHIKKGEIHTIMGPNGSGKSTLAKVIAGHPAYEIIRGEITFMGKNLLELQPEERAHLGIFLSFQYPIEIPGVNNVQFLLHALNAKRKVHDTPPLSKEEFETLLDEKMALMNIDSSFKNRSVNTGFSGGEKKRNEILQMAILNPTFALLDETDSGLDIDAMKVVASGINQFFNCDKGLLIITHYQRLLDYIKPHFVHVMHEGKIVKSGGATLALELEEKGYDWLVTHEEGKPVT